MHSPIPAATPAASTLPRDPVASHISRSQSVVRVPKPHKHAASSPFLHEVKRSEDQSSSTDSVSVQHQTDTGDIRSSRPRSPPLRWVTEWQEPPAMIRFSSPADSNRRGKRWP